MAQREVGTVKVNVVGSSGTFPVAGRPASGYMVEQAGTRVWLDAGPGTFVNLPVDSYMIDAVVISHQHPDHSADIFTAFHAWTYCPDPRKGVPLYAPQEVWDRVVGLPGRWPGLAADRDVRFHPGLDGRPRRHR